MDMLRGLFATDGFMAHGYCYLWNRGLVRLHLFSDLIIGFSYVAISLTLLYLVRRAKRDIPFHWMFIAFGAFIIACGATHFMEVWTLWTPGLLALWRRKAGHGAGIHDHRVGPAASYSKKPLHDRVR